VNKSTRKLALRRVLGDIITGGKVVTVPSFSIEDGKTKSFVAAVSEIAEGKKILIIADSFDEMTKRAGRNVAEVLLMTAAEVNVEQLLDARKVVLVDSAMEIIANRTK
jgi:large subunit ribosomal protein L4